MLYLFLCSRLLRTFLELQSAQKREENIEVLKRFEKCSQTEYEAEPSRAEPSRAVLNQDKLGLVPHFVYNIRF